MLLSSVASFENNIRFILHMKGLYSQDHVAELFVKDSSSS